VTAVGDAFTFEVNGARVSLCVANATAAIGTWDSAAPNGCQGDLIDTWRDPDLMRGKIGLGAQGYVGFDGESSTPAVATIGFDNLVIRTPEGVNP
jgi:hypothetical protein